MALPADASGRPVHSLAFRRRRFFNWFPLGLTYATYFRLRTGLDLANLRLGRNAVHRRLSSGECQDLGAQPGAVLGALIMLRIWNARPSRHGGH